MAMLIEEGAVALLGEGLELPLYKAAREGAALRIGAGVDVEVYVYDADRQLAARLKTGDAHVYSDREDYILVASVVSRAIDDKALEITVDGEAFAPRWTVINMQLNADVDRDGFIDRGEDGRSSWAWGPQGHGAVILVNNDRDVAGDRFGWRDRLDDRRGGALDVQDLAQLSLDIDGPPTLPAGYELRLSLSDAAAAKIRVFSLEPGATRQLIGPGQGRKALPYEVGSRPLGAEALQYPDYGFTGLITVRVILTRRGEPKASDAVLLRVAPWIATSPLNPPERVYVGNFGGNASLRKQLAAACAAAGVPLEEVPLSLTHNDRWLQDEIEIGYSHTPNKTLPVVLDGPRDRPLDDFAETGLLGPDFGWVGRTDETPRPDSLNSFGNLDCTPPLPGYPLGRVLFGGAGHSDDTRHMSKVVTDFLYAQQVQPPVELYSSWLAVGHVDEFLTFVPWDNVLGFKLLLASPRRAFEILADLSQAGKGGEPILSGRKDAGGRLIERPIDGMLNDQKLIAANAIYQRNIDWNRTVLKKEIGVSEAEILDIPVIYTPTLDGADALTANLANMVVLGKHLVTPKPFGPLVGGVCRFEADLQAALAPGLTVHFVDTWDFYHLANGGIHCGTNVRRGPHTAPWWIFEVTEVKRV